MFLRLLLILSLRFLCWSLEVFFFCCNTKNVSVVLCNHIPTATSVTKFFWSEWVKAHPPVCYLISSGSATYKPNISQRSFWWEISLFLSFEFYHWDDTFSDLYRVHLRVDLRTTLHCLFFWSPSTFSFVFTTRNWLLFLVLDFIAGCPCWYARGERMRRIAWSFLDLGFRPSFGNWLGLCFFSKRKKLVCNDLSSGFCQNILLFNSKSYFAETLCLSKRSSKHDRWLVIFFTVHHVNTSPFLSEIHHFSERA